MSINNITVPLRKLVLVIGVGMCAAAFSAYPVHASVPATVYCFESVCISINDHPDHPVKDYYYYGGKGRNAIVFRFKHGSIVQFVLTNRADDCRAEIIQTTGSRELITGAGCIVTTSGAADPISVSVVARSAPGRDVSRVIKHVRPVLWTTGFDEQGRYLATTSPPVPVR